MAAPKINQNEADVLAVMDPEYGYTWYGLPAIDNPIANTEGGRQAILRELCRRKLVSGEGRGMHRSFYIEPKGVDALAAFRAALA